MRVGTAVDATLTLKNNTRVDLPAAAAAQLVELAAAVGFAGVLMLFDGNLKPAGSGTRLIAHAALSALEAKRPEGILAGSDEDPLAVVLVQQAVM